MALEPDMSKLPSSDIGGTLPTAPKKPTADQMESAQAARRVVLNDKMHQNHRILSDAFQEGNKYSPLRTRGVQYADPYAAASQARASKRGLIARAKAAGIPVAAVQSAYLAGERANKLQGSTSLKYAAFLDASSRLSGMEDDYNEVQKYRMSLRRERDLQERLNKKANTLTPDVSSSDETPDETTHQQAPVVWDGVALRSNGAVLKAGPQADFDESFFPANVFDLSRSGSISLNIPAGKAPIKGLFPDLVEDGDKTPTVLEWTAPTIGVAKSVNGLSNDQFYVMVHAKTTKGGRTRTRTYAQIIDDPTKIARLGDDSLAYNPSGTATETRNLNSQKMAQSVFNQQ